ncbi:hypothetical protein RUM44_008515 [Polyplax serrata]|uniref:Uncharacterized protein n=1 Tax=Polyplax serrata TaxID=468196 RepID=A0ABR1B8H2_POLSC
MPGTGSRTSNDPDYKSSRESGEDSEDECEILEESPCGRWLKRREEFHTFGLSTAVNDRAGNPVPIVEVSLTDRAPQLLLLFCRPHVETHLSALENRYETMQQS